MTEASATRMENFKQWVYDHRKPLMAGFAALAVIILIIGLSLMWFVNNKALSTVGKIQAPADLKILGPNQTAIEQINLSYNNTTDKTEIGTDGEERAVVKRAFCVDSGAKGFELQLANTTNISELEIAVYRVEDVTGKAEELKNADVAGLAGGREYAWKIKSDPIAFNRIDPSESNSQTFGSYTNVQNNAYPVYGYKIFGESDLDRGADGKAAAATNFIIQCKWKTKPNVKETDVVYLIARSS